MVGNLELTLPGKAPYKGYPLFRSPDALAPALREAGFDILVTANNHSNDAGSAGLVHTLDILDIHGINHTGTFRNAGERGFHYPLFVYRNGFKLAFLNYSYGTNGLPTKAPTVVNLLDKRQMEADLAVACKLDADFIIVFLHWGLEYQRSENEDQRKLAAKLIEWGADLIVGSHPHVVQPIKWEKGPDDKEVLVAYSLGNFISGQTKPDTDGGILLEVDLIRKAGGEGTSVEAYHFIPVWRQVEQHADETRVYRVLPVAPLEADDNLSAILSPAERKAMEAYAERTRGHLLSFGSTERKVSSEEMAPVPVSGQ